MSFGTTYRYSVKNDQGKWYGMAGRTVVLQDSPYYYYGGIANYEELALRDSRNMRLGGFIRNRTSELQFFDELGKVIRYAKYTRGTGKQLTLYIDRFNTTRLDYDPDGSSDITLNQSRDERNQISSYMMEGGVMEKIKNLENTKYDIPVSGIEVVNVKVLPQLVRGQAIFSSVTPDGNPTNRAVDVFNMLGYSYLKESIIELIDVPNNRPIDYFDVLGTNLAMSGGANSSMEKGQPYQERDSNFIPDGIVKVVNTTSRVVDYLLQANVALTKVSVRGAINIYIKNNHSSSPVDYQVKLYIRSTAAGSSGVTEVGSSVNTATIGASSANTFTFTMNETIFDIPAGHVLYITLKSLTPSVLQQEYMVQGGMPLMVDFQYRTTEYTTPGYNVYTLLSKIVSNITDGSINFDSTQLTKGISYKDGIDCRPDKLQITSTECLQGKANPVISISLKEIIDSLQVWLGSGMTMLRDIVSMAYTQVRVEDWAYFFRDTVGSVGVIAEFESISDWYMEPAEDIMFHTLVVGYEPTQVDKLNINDDVHIKHTYVNNNTSVTNTKEMISPIHASGFALYEEVVKSISNKNGQAGATNDNYVIQYNPTPTAGVYTALYSTDITASPYQANITDPTRLLNPGLTPRRCAERLADWLISHIPFTEGTTVHNDYVLRFVAGERNTKYVSRLATLYPLAENSDIDLELALLLQGKQRLFWPEYLYWTAPSLRNYKKLWELNRFGIFKTHIPTTPMSTPVIKTYPLESVDWSAHNEEYDFKGLLTASNDPSVLKR